MATTIRLTRMGRKQAPFYRVVVCDSRIRRDGAYIESLGFYNPLPDAYELSIDHAKAIEWLDKGAQPTDTARSLLRTEGVLYRWHLQKAGESDIDAKVEEFRGRRVKQSEAIKAKSARELAAWQQGKEKAAKAKLESKTQAETAVVEEAAATEPSEGAVE